MIIKRKESNTVYLTRLFPGDTFKKASSIFLVTSRKGPKTVAVVDLETGKYLVMDYDTEVSPFKCEILEV